MRGLLPAALLALAPLAAAAHGYGEWAPLSPDLRGALIGVLEDATSAGALTAKPAAGHAGLAGLLDRLDREERAWLADALRRRAGAEDPARLPDSVLLPLFYDLADFAAAYQTHGHGADGDATAAADYRRLREILGEATR